MSKYNQGYKNPGQIGTDANLENNLNGYNLDMADGSAFAGRPQQEPSNYDDLDESLLRNNTYNNQQAPLTNRTVPSNIELSEIEIELFNRLLKTGVIRASPNIKTLHDRKIVILDAQATMKFQNGQIFAGYLVVLKEVLGKINQDFAIDQHLPSKLKEQSTPQARLFNWNFLCNELDKIGIIVENDIKSLYVAGDSEEIGRLFTRIERYMKRIAGDAEILNFNEYRKDDRKFNKSNVADVENTNAGGRRGLQSTQKKPVKDGVDIMKMDTGKDPSQTESTLEFILNTLCRALNMKPKQAAALLTNNNQFLTHCCVKGVKSRFEPMINWYQEIYQYSKHLSMMLEVEVENAMASGDPKQIRAAQQNFDKVLQTISCGCYSHNFEVAQICMKTLSCIAQDFNGNIELVQLITKWFESKDNGIYTINYALKRHQDLAEEFVNCIGNFTNGGDQMTWVYMSIMQGFYPDMVEYFNTISHLFAFLAIKYSQELPKGTLLSQLIERGIGFADNDPVNTPQVRIAAMSLINEIWLEFPIYIEKQSNYANPIQHVYKKNSRERIRSVRIVTAVCMFKLLDKFSAEKNPSAPAILKSLVFSLVESPQDDTVRELYLTNFQYLFEQVKSIPVGLIVDPFVKSNQVQDTFQFQTFDYDFFTFLAGHPKLTVQNAIQMLDLLARQYLNDVCSASAAAVPFMLLSSRFMGTLQCQEFIMKFITISLNQLLQIDNAQDTRSTPGNQGGKQKVLALPAPGVRGSSSSLKGKDFRIQSNKKSSQKADMINNRLQTQEEEITSRLKKSQIITMLLKIQNLLQEDVNNAMRDMLLGAQKQYKDQNNGYLSNGIMAVLKYWGDPDHMFNQYLKRQEKIEAEEKKAYERLQRQEQIERRMLGYDSDEKAASQGGQAYESLANGRSLKNARAKGRNSMALLPITENTQNLRAMHELEMIRKYKKDKEYEEKAKQDQLAKKQTVKEKQLKEQLQRRRIEIGVAENVKGVKQEIKALIYKEDEADTKKAIKFRNPMEAQVQLVDLNQEEDRDREIIVAFMKRNAKIWKFLFQRYANQCYSSKQQNNFDDIGRKTSQISLAEITKMLRDLNTYPILLSKEELSSIIRLINMGSSNENASDLAMLDYPQFIQFIPQLAFLSFSRPPIDKSHLPPVESLNALLTQFEQATRDRGKSTQLYEDPDQSSMQDRELMQALDKKINQDPNYPVPEGYTKVIEKMPIYTYKVPECAAKFLKESKVMATEMMDEILFEVLGIHFLEPQVKFDVRYKVKQAIKKQSKPAEALGYMKKAEKKTEELVAKKTNANALLSAAEKRKQDLEVRPKLQLAQKLQVMKQDLKTRPHWQEVAEIFEEMIAATEKGLDQLPNRLNRAPGQVQNEAKLLKAQKELEDKEIERQREEKRKERDLHVKDLIKETNFGGREMEIHKFRNLKQKTEKKEQEIMGKQERLEFRKQAEVQKQKYDNLKSKNIDELKKKKEEEQLQQEIEKKMAEKIRKEFLSKQKKKLKGDFQETYKARDDLIVKKEAIKVQEDQNKSNLQDQMNKYIKNTKADREQEKQERLDVQEFLKRPDVVSVFKTYERPLLMMYKFYASQDKKTDAVGFDLDYLHNVLSFQELVRWGYQQNVTPNFVSPDEMVNIYKNLVRETEDSKDSDFNLEQKTLAAADLQKQGLEKYSETHKKSGFIDYEAFKKAIVRISVIAQEKLDPNATSANEDLLKKKLQQDKKTNEEKSKQKEKMLSQISKQDEKKKLELEKLREQFDEEQKYKQDNLSKNVSKNKKEKKETELTVAQQKRTDDKQYQLDQAKIIQEEEFFNKWLKQRENLGVAGVPEDQPLASARTRIIAQQKTIKKKDMTQKELEDIDKQMKEQQKMGKVKIENKKVRKSIDVGIISASTIEAFIMYLELKEDDKELDVNKKLNNTMMNRKTTVRQSPAANGGKGIKNSDLNDRA